MAPSNSGPGIATDSPRGLFRIVGLPRPVQLDPVYFDGRHTLVPFTIINKSNQALRVYMRSNLGVQVTFQTANANLEDGAAATPAAYNELLNQIDPIDQVQLQPAESRPLILLFRPAEPRHATRRKGRVDHGPGRRRPLNSSNASDYGSDAGEMTESRSELPTSDDNADDDVGEEGTTARQVTPNARGSPAASTSVNPLRELRGTIFFHAYVGDSVPWSENSDVLDTLEADTQPDVPAADATTIPFQARVGRSVLRCDAAAAGVHLDNCLAGDTYAREVVVENRSAAPLHWTWTVARTYGAHPSPLPREIAALGLDVDLYAAATAGPTLVLAPSQVPPGPIADDPAALTSDLHLTDASADQPLAVPSVVPAYGAARIRLTFHPRGLGEYAYTVRLANSHNDDNTVEFPLRAVVLDAPRNEPLVVEGPAGTLDFGDCYGGQWCTRRVVLRNLGAHSLRVRFVTSGPDLAFLRPPPMKGVRRKRFQAPLTASDSGSLATPRQVTGRPDHRAAANRACDPGRSVDKGQSLDSPSAHRQPGGSSSSSGGSDLEADTESPVEELASPDPPSTPLSRSTHSFGSLTSSTHHAPAGDSRPDSSLDSNDAASSADEVSAASAGHRRPAWHPPAPPVADPLPVYPTDTHDSTASETGLVARALVHPRAEVSTTNRRRSLSGTFPTPRDTAALADAALAARRLTEVTVRPGSHRAVDVAYRPPRDRSAADFRAGRFTRRSFFVVFAYGPLGPETPARRKVVHCMARSCTALIRVTPTTVDFGDTDVGTLKSQLLSITNVSMVRLQVSLAVRSKILYCYPAAHLPIEPGQTVRARLDICPRKVNPGYYKQVTVLNLANRADDQVVEVRSNHVDHGRVTFHALFYRLYTPSGQNLLEFGATPHHGLGFRVLMVENISAAPLRLEIGAVPGARLQAMRFRIPDGFDLAAAQRELAALIPCNLFLRSGSGVADDHLPAVTTDASERPDNGAVLAPSLPNPVPTAQADPSPVASAAADRPWARVTRPTTARDRVHAYLDLAQPTATGGRDAAARRLTGAKRHLILVKPLTRPGRPRTEPAPPPPPPTSVVAPVEHPVIPDTSAQRLGVNDARVFEWFQNQLSATLPASATRDAEYQFVKHQAEVRGRLETLVRRGLLAPAGVITIRPRSKLNLAILLQPGEGAHGDGESPTPGEPHGDRVPAPPTPALPTAADPGSTRHSVPFDGKLAFRLLDFDRLLDRPQFAALLASDPASLPPRELLVRASVFRPRLELGQRRINFGVVTKDEPRTYRIPLRNPGPAPLLYALKKSGSVASGCIHIQPGQRYGVVRGYDERELGFTFTPTLAGAYLERLWVEAVQDPSCSQEFWIKATVRKPGTFEVRPLGPQVVLEGVAAGAVAAWETVHGDRTTPARLVPPLALGPCLLGRACPAVGRFTLHNTTGKRRAFVIYLDHEVRPDAPVRFRVTYHVPRAQADPSRAPRRRLSNGATAGKPDKQAKKGDKEADDDDGTEEATPRAVEEKIEQLEQKLKIAKRKERAAKVTKVEGQLVDLRTKLAALQLAGPGSKSTGADDGSHPAAPTPSQDRLTRLLQGEPGADRAVSQATVTPHPTATDTPAALAAGGNDDAVAPGLFTLEANARKYPDQCKLTLAPYATATVEFALAVVRDAGFEEGPSPPVPVCGRLLIHEHRNVDERQSVGFAATLCYSRRQFLRQLPTDVPIPADMTTPSHEVPPHDQPTVPEASAPLNLFTVAAKCSVLTCEVGKTVRLAFTAQGSQPSTAGLAVPLPVPYHAYLAQDGAADPHADLTAHPSTVTVVDGDRLGTVSPAALAHDALTIRPAIPGILRPVLVIRNLRTGTVVSLPFTVYVYDPAGLAFPSLAVAPLALDLGACYIDVSRRLARAVPLTVRNDLPFPVRVACRSNLAHQVALLQTSADDGPVAEAFVTSAGATVTVWAAVLITEGMRQHATHTRSSDADATSPAAPWDTPLAATPQGPPVQCRDLVGGLQFHVSAVSDLGSEGTPIAQFVPAQSSAADGPSLFTHIVKFQAQVGESNLDVHPRRVDFGTVTDLGTVVHGRLRLTNGTVGLPAEYRIEVPLGADLVVTQPSGVVDSTPGAEAEVAFRVHCRAYGFFVIPLEVVNVRNRRQRLHVSVQYFVDGGLLRLLIPSEAAPAVRVAATADAPTPSLLPAPLALTWESVCVTAEAVDHQALMPHDGTDSFPAGGSAGAYVLHPVEPSPLLPRDLAQNRPTWRTLVVRNAGPTPLQLYPLANTRLRVTWSVAFQSADRAPRTPAALSPGATTREFFNDDDAPEGLAAAADGTFPPYALPDWKPCGPSTTLAPYHAARLFVRRPEPWPLGLMEVASLAAGHVIRATSQLVLFSPRAGCTLSVVPVAVPYGQSAGAVSPTTVDLPALGYRSAWRPVSFHFEVSNRTNVPLAYLVDCPPGFQVTNVATPIEELPRRGGDDDEVGMNPQPTGVLTGRDAALGQRHHVTLTVHPDQLPDRTPGPRSWTLPVRNLVNPADRLSIRVTAVLTALEVVVEHVQDGAAVLPALPYPALPDGRASDTWFTVRSTADRDLTCAVGTAVTAPLAPYFEVELLSRFSNSPLNGSVLLRPFGTAEIRVRARPRPGHRPPVALAADLAERRDGTALGHIWVRTALEDGEGASEVPGVVGEDARPVCSPATDVAVDDNGNPENTVGQPLAHRIALRAHLTEQPIFKLSTAQLRFVYDPLGPGDATPQSVVITNLSAADPLHFKIYVERPRAFRNARPLRFVDFNPEADNVVPPGGFYRLRLTLALTDAGGYPAQVTLHVEDQRSVTGLRRAVVIHMTERSDRQESS
ncbi:hypothetical protein IWQ60_000681 [Tieghemiomyces parasiticus]|uniref:Uncharacterized protein n=1 Tax=Tieghemiomyces parasiticus TaxID=78921 RepID=A0A9W8DYZ8_9FUNG|nr:hypothetical protein IWQ60_000681 [Tieghemiomyces parasiticus]